LETQFYQFYARLQQVTATGFCAEVIVFRKYLDILMDSLAGDAHDQLEIDNSTMETFRNLETLLKCTSLSQVTYVSLTYKLAKMAMDLVINKYGALLNPNFINQEKFA